MAAQFMLSAFGDEISDDLTEQLNTLRNINIRYLELRGVWGKNVLELTDEEIDQIQKTSSKYDIQLSSIGSPIGKSALSEPPSYEIRNMDRALEIADKLDVACIRVFSFYPPVGTLPHDHNGYVQEVADRLTELVEVAEKAGKTLFLENEKGIIGDTIERCALLLSTVDKPTLRFAWDPANFVQVGEGKPTTDGWAHLGSYTEHVHIKDSTEDGHVTPAGEGDGEVGLLLEHLRDVGYQGYLALEPHLEFAGHSTGFSGIEGMTLAAEKLRALMTDRGCTEVT